VLLERQELSGGVLPGQQLIGLVDAIAGEPAPTGFCVEAERIL